VEQFDVQQPELTVRETLLFSARLRLNSEDPNLAGDEVKEIFVDSVLKTLELTSLADSLVGTDGEGGLSFEQRKRVSIAVELAASPSVIFLDEVRCRVGSWALELLTLRRTLILTCLLPHSQLLV
jgi:ABC-type multidrug transport system ATPase subunit